MDNQNRQEDDYRWDPESAYAKSGSRRLIAFILAVIILGAEHGNITSRYYEGKSVLGLLPAFSVLEYIDGEESEFRIGHSFEDEKGSSAEKPGKVYLHLKKELTALLGEPETRSDVTGSYLAWPRKNSREVLLWYMADGMPMLYFLYYSPLNSL